MKIGKFFTEQLGANLANIQWSWGATNPITNHVFLRVWRDELESVDGIERSPLLAAEWKGKSNGYPERERHVKALLAGAEGFGVLCTVKDPAADRRVIAYFDDQTLLKFGEVVVEDGKYFGVVTERVAVSQFANQRTSAISLLPDIKKILSRRIEATEKETLASARLGQGLFRKQVLSQWNNRCCVTGSTLMDAVRASHIKPWCRSNDLERLDPHNGLPLVATLDALFDVGLISFADNGVMLVSSKVPSAEVDVLDLGQMKLSQMANDTTLSYLKYHRDHIFRQ